VAEFQILPKNSGAISFFGIAIKSIRFRILSWVTAYFLRSCSPKFLIMDISGKLVQVLPTQTGTSGKGEWKKCSFVIETADKFPKKVCIVAWKDLVDQVQQIPAGSQVNVSFDVESREYNGKWYTDVKAWKVVSGGGSSAGQQYNRVEAPIPSSEPPMGDGIDDLPF
jgi:hypothetical protein